MPVQTFDDMLNEMVVDNPQIGHEMIEEALALFFANELEDVRILLRQYVKATIGFVELSKRTGKSDKNLMRALSAKGNPTMETLGEIFHALQPEAKFRIVTETAA
jgi:DNA-binding phage protein